MSRVSDNATGSAKLIGNLSAETIADLLLKIPTIVTELAVIREILSQRQKSHLTVEEVARLTGRAAYTVRHWITQGRIDAIRVQGTGPKGRLLVPKDELKKLVSSGSAAQLPDSAID